ncbi:MAG: hypothetical protein GXP14_01615 [Gammaproteobacteria bacterium]|nr:hypothetical protein [Gammaproteobacteria bacterium]
MFDIDYAPGVFATIIAFVVILPALYGIFFVDAYYEQHQKEEADDAFN